MKQNVGTRHNLDHIDCSQILMAVAGWCLVFGPGQKDYVWMRTADVYRHPEFYPLVVADGKPLSRHVYTGTAREPKPSRPGP